MFVVFVVPITVFQFPELIILGLFSLSCAAIEVYHQCSAKDKTEFSLKP